MDTDIKRRNQWKTIRTRKEAVVNEVAKKRIDRMEKVERTKGSSYRRHRDEREELIERRRAETVRDRVADINRNERIRII